jgi:hypothetical protein
MKTAKFYGDKSRTSQLIRHMLRPEPSSRSSTPKWVLNSVKAAIKLGRLPKFNIPLLSANDALQHALGHLGRSWADHPGLIKWDGHELLVTEPYADRIDLEMLQELQQFREVIGGAFVFSANSAHFPGRTVRIVVAENSGVLARYKTSDYASAELIARSAETDLM